MKREEVYKLIDGERDYQDQQWPENIAPTVTPTMNTYYPLRIGEDLALIEVYLRKALDTWSTERRPEFETMGIIRKIAGICVRSMETNGAPMRNPPNPNLNSELNIEQSTEPPLAPPTLFKDKDHY
jgi:hypothetical protein